MPSRLCFQITGLVLLLLASIALLITFNHEGNVELFSNTSLSMQISSSLPTFYERYRLISSSFQWFLLGLIQWQTQLFFKFRGASMKMISSYSKRYNSAIKMPQSKLLKIAFASADESEGGEGGPAVVQDHNKILLQRDAKDVQLTMDHFLIGNHRVAHTYIPPPQSSSSSTDIASTDSTCDAQEEEFLPSHLNAIVVDEEPHVGMLLEVLPSSMEASSSSDKEGDVARYELTEQIYDELGLVDEHHLDFAYIPWKNSEKGNQEERSVKNKVVTMIHTSAPSDLPSSEFNELLEGRGDGIDESTQQEQKLSDANQLQAIKVDSATTTATRIAEGQPSFETSKLRWQWLFDYSQQTAKIEDDKEGDWAQDFYEKMGERAFAGGSHGEVWLARRRCDLFPTSQDNREGKNSGSGMDSSPPPCDDQQELIMKRLKIELGFDVLEAGLREVYFGQLLERETKSFSAPLFTTYVDHFFREGPNASFLRGSSSKKNENTELWIVFVNAGASLRNYLYTPVTSGGLFFYQHSAFWRRLRMGVANKIVTPANKSFSSLALPTTHENDARNQTDPNKGKLLMREVLRQLLSSVAFLHEHGIVHRDIKPANILCKATQNGTVITESDQHIDSVECVLGDFSSAWDEFSSQKLYSHGPSAAEQTDDYAPPEVLFGSLKPIPFDEQNPQSYDSWSIGVVALEMLLGTPHVFSVDQRTTAILTRSLEKKGATPDDIQKALFLAALSQFCIYIPTAAEEKSWPLRDGDPLHLAEIGKVTCTMHDFRTALHARDPLGIGFDSSSDLLLELILGLLAWNPSERISPSQALNHPYFKSNDNNSSAGGGKTSDHHASSPSKPATRRSSRNFRDKALSSQTFDESRFSDIDFSDLVITEFLCPKCKRSFQDWRSCHVHANSRKHSKFCSYDQTLLPPCLSSHSMLPAHPTSGYCDIQGRRQTIEDFHSIHLELSHQFYGVFDGHHGNLASKYAASKLYGELAKRLADVDDDARGGGDNSHLTNWKDEVTLEVSQSFHDLHTSFLQVLERSPRGVMNNSGTTATLLYVTEEVIIVANVGDSRAILSVGASYDPNAGEASALQLTVDHTPAEETERQRIIDSGGFISAAGGIDRVNGTLAVSRSIGDVMLAPILSRDPHVVAMTKEDVRKQCRGESTNRNTKSEDTDLSPESDFADFPCFVVLASDGLWDVFSNQEAVDMVIHVLRHSDAENQGISWEDGGVFQEAAQRLTREAFVRGSTDNIGVCVVAIT